MILVIGEILADMIGKDSDGKLDLAAYVGGAPFNVAVNAKQAGAKVGFIGRVGSDPLGAFLKRNAARANLDYLDVQTDPVRNTTIAFVTLLSGERDFAFLRNGTADYFIDVKNLNLKDFPDLNVVHLGSLMLSESEGVVLANDILKKAKAANKLLSFDVNFRTDLYQDFDAAKKAYAPFIEKADILKFSDDEILAFTGLSDINTAIDKVYRKDMLLLLTMGAKGSKYVYNELSGFIPTEKVIPVDTTGAGDAFFGTTLANLDGKEFTGENIEKALIKGNEAGAKATLFKGAIKLCAI